MAWGEPRERAVKLSTLDGPRAIRGLDSVGRGGSFLCMPPVFKICLKLPLSHLGSESRIWSHQVP